MTGSGMEEGLNSTLNAPAHRSATFPGVMLFAIICLVSFIYAIGSSGTGPSIALILVVGFGVGALAGYVLTNTLNRMNRRQRARFEQEFQAEREREFQRKLAEAKARGEIK